MLLFSGKCPIHRTLRAFVECTDEYVVHHCAECAAEYGIDSNKQWQRESITHCNERSVEEYKNKKLYGELRQGGKRLPNKEKEEDNGDK